MAKILGLDLGTNSIGWTIRNSSLDDNQFERYGVITFKKGVGEGKSGEYSFAAERTKNRSVRRLYQARKYRLWETLRVLIDNDYCPLSIEDLDHWRKYNKEKGLFREYPIHAKGFEKWIRLDFSNQNISAYSSPYQLRKELIERKFDLTNKIDRYKIGRALYHIAQRRGFKSSRKTGDKENTSVYNGSKESGAKGVKDIKELIERHKTLGAAQAFIETSGERVRNQYTLRKYYQDEIKKIFEIQEISIGSIFYEEINKAIFYQRPLRSQKGLVGKCTLEPSKSRCPISHPLFEEFRAWSFLNNIQYKNDTNDKWSKLSLTLKEDIYNEKFFRKTKDYFAFSEIREFLEKKGYKWILNYKDKTNISGCPVSARLKDLFGVDLLNYMKITDEIRLTIKEDGSIKEHKISYKLEDIWHILFSFEDEECVSDFAKIKLELDDEKINGFITAWKQLPDGYSMLSLNAIKKIIPFLRKGYIYTEAVLLANMPNVLGKTIWEANKAHLESNINGLIEINRSEKQLLNIANELISKWYANKFRSGHKDSTYILDEVDKQLIQDVIIDTYGNKTWEEKTIKEKEMIFSQIAYIYQCFFRNDFEWIYIKDDKYYVIKTEVGTFYKNFGSGYFKVPHLLDSIKQYFKEKFNITDKQLEKLYHPSQIEIYPKAKPNKEGKILLQSPRTGSFRNPMAMRTLYELRKLINYLISTDEIDEETEIVVELARELNDANKRWAIETYQKRREEENKEFAIAITELLNDPEVIGRINADPNNIDDIDKFRLWHEQVDYEKYFKKEPAINKLDKDGKEIENNDPRKYDWNNIRRAIVQKVIEEKDLIKKYRLWKEQGCRCLYTGNVINLTDLFDENVIDFEHTIPRSISFDNSLANLTICYASYNRNIKKNRIPTELENYNIDWNNFTAIKPRLNNWVNRVEELRMNIEFWKKKSKLASDKEAKDYAIRQRHLWQFELDYWENKLTRFTMLEVKSGFKNSQLIDTQLISKYAFHYLKTVFNKVNVQKGSITAEFRKIYSIQHKDNVKDRNKHSHHAIDAAVLTLIPSSAKREDILKKSFEHSEKWKLGKIKKEESKQYHEKPYPNFNLKFISEIGNNILINNSAKDQAFTPAKRIYRKNGKIVPLRDKDGKKIFGENGKIKVKIVKGDSIRGQLHLDTFYGKIKVVQRDENNNPIINDKGKFVFKEKNDGFMFVVRKPVNMIKRIDEIVDPHIRIIIKQQLNGRTLEKAFSEGIWMIKRNGEKDKKFRHLRCFADITDPLTIKKQTYLSKEEYKQNYYAANATSFLYALYEDENGKRKFIPLNLFSATQIKREIDVKNNKDFFESSFTFGKSNNIFRLSAILRPGLKVLFYRDGDKTEIYGLSKQELLGRLYFIKNLFDAKTGTVQFQFHLEARSDKQLSEAFPKEQFGQKGKNGFSEINFLTPWPRLLLSPINFDFLIEKRDFEIKPDGEIVFK